MPISPDDTDRMAPNEQPDYVQLPPGTMIAEHYLLAQVLGSGGEGLVYAGLDTQLGRGVAIKVIAYDDVESRARLRREARIGNLLGADIQGVVRCLEWGELPERGLYIVQDIVDEAEPLDLTKGPREDRLRRLREAAELVALVHSRGVVHRDLKPANFLVDAAGTLFLTDFGLAKQIGEDDVEVEDDLTVKGRAMGTPAYMPLEQFQNARDVDYRADVYALGAMLYLALTGQPPFSGDSMKVLTQQVKANYEGRELRPSLLSESEVAPELDELCAQALALDVDQRLATAKEFLARISASQRDPAGATVPPPRPTRRTPRPPRKELEAELLELTLAGERARAKVTGFVDERRRLARREGDQRPLLLRSAPTRRLLELEARLLEVAHPNLVPLLGRGASQQGEVLVIEPTPPVPPALPLAVALDFALDLFAGLAALHERAQALPELSRACLGVAFRPASLRLPPPDELVELSSRGEARLVFSDLSGARSLATLASLAQGEADPELPAPSFLHPLAAPEVFERLEGGAAPSDPRGADVYAAGHLLQDLLVKQPPYRGRTGEELRELKRAELAGRLACDEAALGRLPAALGELVPLVRALLSPRPRERPAIGEALSTLAQVSQASPRETPVGRLLRAGYR